MTLEMKVFENVAGSGENAANQHFHTVFCTLYNRIIYHFRHVHIVCKLY